MLHDAVEESGSRSIPPPRGRPSCGAQASRAGARSIRRCAPSSCALRPALARRG